MARAKRTDRAEARRRYRAQRAAEAAPAEDVEPSGPERGPTAKPGRASQPPPAAGPGRPSIVQSLRTAFRPANLREDLAALPRLVLHPSFWAPALAIVATAGTVVAFDGREVISRILFTYFVYPPPIGAIFIGGFFAPRASYLIGSILGTIATVALATAVAVNPTGVVTALGGSGLAPSAGGSPSPGPSASPAASASVAASPSGGASPSAAPSASPAPSGSPATSPAPTASPAPTPRAPTIGELQQFVASGLLVSVSSGIFFGAAAAWYRRFLRLAAPNRQAAANARNRSRQSRRR